MSSRIEQIIGEIEDYIDKCRPQAFAPNKIAVNKEELVDLLEELRKETPKEIERYQKIISQKEAILADAQGKADDIIARAQAKNEKLTNEHQIMHRAYEESNKIIMQAENEAEEMLSEARLDSQRIVDDAVKEANQIRMGIMQYTNEILEKLETTIGHSLEEAKVCHINYINSLQGFYDLVSSNHAELEPVNPQGNFDSDFEEEDFSQEVYEEE